MLNIQMILEPVKEVRGICIMCGQDMATAIGHQIKDYGYLCMKSYCREEYADQYEGGEKVECE